MNTSASEAWALLDSGATHPLCGLWLGDDLEGMKKVQLTLGDGSQVPTLMTASQVLAEQRVHGSPSREGLAAGGGSRRSPLHPEDRGGGPHHDLRVRLHGDHAEDHDPTKGGE